MRSAEPCAAIPTRARLIRAVVTLRDFAECPRPQEMPLFAIEKWVQESDGVTQHMIDSRDQTCPQRRHLAGTSLHDMFLIYEQGIVIRIRGHIRETPPAR